ncbi:MAG: hypothetical protein PHH37_09360 [Paludibacter sp.]|nr:hypothetical protein [Paludibacter sp.]
MNQHFQKLFFFVLISSFTSLVGAKTISDFPLIHEGYLPDLVIDTNDAEVVSIAANAFVHDALLVSTNNPHIYNSIVKQKLDVAIIAGTLGKSQYIDDLAKHNKINVQSIQGKWETFSFTFLGKPIKGVKRALVIAGSDRRATAYGIFELSRMIGVCRRGFGRPTCYLLPDKSL